MWWQKAPVFNAQVDTGADRSIWLELGTPWYSCLNHYSIRSIQSWFAFWNVTMSPYRDTYTNTLGQVCHGLVIALRSWTAHSFHKSVLSHVIRCLHSVCMIPSQESSPGFSCKLRGVWVSQGTQCPLGSSTVSARDILLIIVFYECLLCVRCFTDIMFNLLNSPIREALLPQFYRRWDWDTVWSNNLSET